jgi:signal transduction histidine kinase
MNAGRAVQAPSPVPAGLLEALSRLSRRLATAHNSREILEALTGAALTATGAEGAWASLVSSSAPRFSLWVKSGRVPPQESRKEFEQHLVEAWGQDTNEEVPLHGTLWRALVAPVTSDGQLLAQLAVFTRLPGAFGQQAHETLQWLSDFGAMALVRGRELAVLGSAGRSFSGSIDADEVIRNLAETLLDAAGAVACTIYRRDVDAHSVNVVAVAGEAQLPVGSRVELSGNLHIEEVLESGLHMFPAGAAADGPDSQLDEPGAYLPVKAHGSVYGLVELSLGNRAAALTPSRRRLLEAVINQAAMAMERAQLFEDTIQRELFFAALGRVTLAINASVELPTVLDLICQESMSLFTADGAYIWQVSESQLVSLAGRGYARASVLGSVTALDDASLFPAAVVQTGVGVFRSDLQKQKTVRLGIPGEESVKAALGLPLQMGGEIIGVLVLVDTRDAHCFKQTHLEQATLFGVQAAIAIRNARMVTELREFNEQLDARVAERTAALDRERDRVKYLLRVASELSATLDQDRVMYRALQLINEFVQATHGAILLVDAETGRLVHPPAYDARRAPPISTIDLGHDPERGLAGWVVRSREHVIVEDTLQDPRCDDVVRRLELRSALGLPLVSGEEVIGVLLLFHRRARAFSGQQLELVEAVARQIGSALGNAQLFLLIRDQAEHLGRMLREEHVEAAKNQAILESIADGVLVADSSGQVILANMAASVILEIDRSRLQGKALHELLGLYGATGDDWIATIDQWARSAPTDDQRPYLADRLTLGDKAVSLSLSPVFARNQFFGTVSIFRDVTKEVEVDRMKSEFVSTVSHEMRTPMTAIKGYADLMLMGASGTLSPMQTRYLGIIRNNANRMTSLVNDLLDISRIESGKTELELQPVNVAQLIGQVVTSHLHDRMKQENKQLNVTTNVPDELPPIEADPARLTQMLANLIDNAYHYTPQEGAIEISARAHSGRIVINIKDTGIGIAEEEKPKIFERFYRSEVDMVQRTPGTGLGLAIVRSLVDMHSGTIDVKSELGKGSVFTLTLPVGGPGGR